MAEALTLTRQDDPALAAGAEAHKPVTKTQQNMSRDVATYMRKFVRLYPHFYWDQKIDRNNALNEMGRIWPDKDADNQAVARRLQEDIADVIAAAPISKANPMVLVRVWAVSSHSEASLEPVKTVPQPNEPVVIAPFDGIEGNKSRYFVPVFNELPTFKDMSIDFGLMVLCQAVPPLISQFADNRPVGYGGGPGVYGDRTNHDKFQAGNDSGDPEALVQMPFGETSYFHLPPSHPAEMVSPSETSATLLSSEVMEGAASMTALGEEESSGETSEKGADEREQTNRAGRPEPEQTVEAVTPEASPALEPVMGAAGIAALAQDEAASQTGMPPEAPEAGAPEAEFGEAPTRPILRDSPAEDDASLSATDRAQEEQQLEQKAVREAEDAGEITPDEAAALDRMPNAYDREEALETEEQRDLPEADGEGGEAGLRAAEQEILEPEGAGENGEEANLEEAGPGEEEGRGETAEVAAEQGGALEAAPGAEGADVAEALSGAEGEVLGQTAPESEAGPELAEPSSGDEAQQAAAEITGEPGDSAEPQADAEAAFSEPTVPESATSESAAAEGEAPSTGAPEGEAPEAEPQEPQELNASPDEANEPQANAPVPDPVSASGETGPGVEQEPESNQNEPSVQEIKDEADKVRDQFPEEEPQKQEYQGAEREGSELRAQGPENRPEGLRDEPRPEGPGEGVREGRARDDRSDERSDERAHSVHGAGAPHHAVDAAVEQGQSSTAHQLDHLHHMHEAMEENGFAPHMRPDVGLMHGAHPPGAYQVLPQGGTAGHNPALSAHPLTTGVLKIAAKAVKAGAGPVAVVSAAVAAKAGRKPNPSKATAKIAADIRAVASPSKRKRQAPIDNSSMKGSEPPPPEPGGA